MCSEAITSLLAEDGVTKLYNLHKTYETQGFETFEKNGEHIRYNYPEYVYKLNEKLEPF